MHSRSHPHNRSPSSSSSHVPLVCSYTDVTNDESVGYSFRNYEPMIPHPPTPPASSHMLIHPPPPETMHDDDPPQNLPSNFWSPPPAPHSPQPNFSHNQPMHSSHLHLPSSPDHAQHLHQLNRTLSPGQQPANPADIVPPQQPKHPLQSFHPSHMSIHTPVPPAFLSTSNGQPLPYLLQIQQQLAQPAPTATSSASSHLLSPTPHAMVTRTSSASGGGEGVTMRPSASQPPKDSSRFCLPQNRSGRGGLKQETTEVEGQDATRMGGVGYEEEQREPEAGLGIDDERYVKEAARIAEEAKLTKRKDLKEQQRRKEEEAGREGRSLTAKDKERERSRRESAVTRKRAEVYISELERHTRKVPRLEWKIESLEEDVRRLKRTLGDRAGVSVKEEEEGVMMSPNSTRTTRNVMSAFKELDL